MDKRELQPMDEGTLDRLLAENLPELPPEEVVSTVNPWKTAVYLVLTGLSLQLIQLRFLYLDALLPAVGAILQLIGFRRLRRENRGFRLCWAMASLRMVRTAATLCINSTVYGEALRQNAVMQALTPVPVIAGLVLLIGFRSGLREIRQKAGLEPNTKGATRLILWYLLLLALALIRYSGLLVPIAMLVGYGFIIRDLVRLARDFGEVGYAVEAAPVRVPDGVLSGGIAAALVIGVAASLLLGSKYPMDWTPRREELSEEVQAVRQELLEMDFPEAVLDDLTPEELLEMKGAKRLAVQECDHPFNEGRQVKRRVPREEAFPSPLLEQMEQNGIEQHDWVTEIDVVYDVKELHITGVAVELPGDGPRWKVIHHFAWRTDPGFPGTECLQLIPAYLSNGRQGWWDDGNLTGRVLYDDEGQTFIAPYVFLDRQHYEADTFLGHHSSTDLFAAFSLPRAGEHKRGYVCYDLLEADSGWVFDSMVWYCHQQKLWQYPVKTAMEQRMQRSGFRDDPFRTVYDALQLRIREDEILDLS